MLEMSSTESESAGAKAESLSQLCEPLPYSAPFHTSWFDPVWLDGTHTPPPSRPLQSHGGSRKAKTVTIKFNGASEV